MSSPKVHRLSTAVALVLVLATAPALAAPGPHPHAAQAPVASLSLLDRLLDWLGFPAAEAPARGLQGMVQKSTAVTPVGSSTTDSRTTLNRGAMVDPNG
ncbi:MAG: hypothetical protein WAM82_20575 [Thermoanaerobaculia bacterium]